MDTRIFRPGLGVARTWRAFGRFHQVPADIAAAGLTGQLNRYASGQWTGFLLYGDGFGIAMPSSPTVPELPDELWQHLRLWSEALNREMAEDGHWIVAWDHTEGEARLLWRDGDGDLQIVIEIDHGMPRILDWTVLDALNQASAALAIYEEKMRGLGADRPTIKLAQGERPH